MDPYEYFRQASRLQRNAFQEPEPEEEPEVRQPETAKIQRGVTPGKVALSALAGAGNLLDVPGSMVRDTLALRNPFDQLASPFSDKNRTTGRDLNRLYGLSGKDDTWGNFAGGLATEIGTDPLSWATLGLWGAGKSVATKAGRALEKSGLTRLTKEAAESAGKAPTSNILPWNKSKAVKMTERKARPVTTPLDVIKQGSDAERDLFIQQTSKELKKTFGDLTPEQSARIAEEAELHGERAAKYFYDKIKNTAVKPKDKLDPIDFVTSVGGNIQINAPFGSRGLKSVDKPINWVASKLGMRDDLAIDGVIGANRYVNEADDAFIKKLDSMDPVTDFKPLGKEADYKAWRKGSKDYARAAAAAGSTASDPLTGIEREAAGVAAGPPVEAVNQIKPPRRSFRQFIDEDRANRPQLDENTFTLGSWMEQNPELATSVMKVIKPKTVKKMLEGTKARILRERAIDEILEPISDGQTIQIKSINPKKPNVVYEVSQHLDEQGNPVEGWASFKEVGSNAPAKPATLEKFAHKYIQGLTDEDAFKSTIVTREQMDKLFKKPKTTENKVVPQKQQIPPQIAPQVQPAAAPEALPPASPQGDISSQIADAASQAFANAAKAAPVAPAPQQIIPDVVPQPVPEAVPQVAPQGLKDLAPTAPVGRGKGTGLAGRKKVEPKPVTPAAAPEVKVDPVVVNDLNIREKLFDWMKSTPEGRDLPDDAVLSDLESDKLLVRKGLLEISKNPAKYGIDEVNAKNIMEANDEFLKRGTVSSGKEYIDSVQNILRGKVPANPIMAEIMSTPEWTDLTDRIHRFLTSQLGSALRKANVDPDDVISETAQKLLRSELPKDMQNYEPSSKEFANWVAAAARNTARDMVDKSQALKRGGGASREASEVLGSVASRELSPDEMATTIERAEQARNAINNIEDDFVRSVAEGVMAGKDNKTIASELDVDVREVRKALGHVRKALEDERIAGSKVQPAEPQVSKGTKNGQESRSEEGVDGKPSAEGSQGQGRDASIPASEGQGIEVSPKQEGQVLSTAPTQSEDIIRDVSASSGDIPDSISASKSPSPDLAKYGTPAQRARITKLRRDQTKLINSAKSYSDPKAKESVLETAAKLKAEENAILSEIQATLDNASPAADNAVGESINRGTQQQRARLKKAQLEYKRYEKLADEARDDESRAEYWKKANAAMKREDKIIAEIQAARSKAAEKPAPKEVAEVSKAENAKVAKELEPISKVGNAFTAQATDEQPMTLARFELVAQAAVGEDKAKSVSRIIEALASAEGLEADDWMQKRIGGFRFDPDAPRAEQANAVVGFLNDARAVIVAFRKDDVAAILHEIGHVARRALNADLQSKADKFVGFTWTAERQFWSREQEEKFARAWERYFYDGKAPTEELKSVFARLTQWFKEIYLKLSGSPIAQKLDKNIREVFDRMLTKDGNLPVADPTEFRFGEDALNSAARESASQVKMVEDYAKDFVNNFDNWGSIPKTKATQLMVALQKLGLDTSDEARTQQAISELVETYNDIARENQEHNQIFEALAGNKDWVAKYNAKHGKDSAAFKNLDTVIDSEEMRNLGINDDRAIKILQEGRRQTDLFSKDSVNALDKRLSQDLAAKGWYQEYFTPTDGTTTNLLGEIEPVAAAKKASGDVDKSRQMDLLDLDADPDQELLFQAKPASNNAKFDLAYQSAQAWSELEENVFDSPVGDFMRSVFDSETLGLVNRTQQERARQAERARKEAQIEARKVMSPLAVLWANADFLDEGKLIKAAIKGPVKDRKAATILARQKITGVTNGIYEYLEGINDQLPDVIARQPNAAKWKEAIDSVKLFMGTKTMTVREHAQKWGIHPEEAARILGDNIVGADGLLKTEYDAGVTINPLMDRYAEYSPRQRAALPSKNVWDKADPLAKSTLLTAADSAPMRRDPHRGPVLDPSDLNTKQRSSAFSNVPGGTAMLNRMSVDDNISGIAHLLRTVDDKFPKNSRGAELPEYQIPLDGARIATRVKHWNGKEIDVNVESVKRYMRTKEQYAPWFNWDQRLDLENKKKYQELLNDGITRDDIEEAISMAQEAGEAYPDWLDEDLAGAIRQEMAYQDTLDLKLNQTVAAVANLDPRHSLSQTPIFSTDIFGSYLFRAEQGLRAATTAKIIQNILTDAKFAARREDIDFSTVKFDNIGKPEEGLNNPTIESILEQNKINTLTARRNLVEMLGDMGQYVKDTLKDMYLKKMDLDGKINWLDDFGVYHSLSRTGEFASDGNSKWLYKKSFPNTKAADYDVSPYNTIDPRNNPASELYEQIPDDGIIQYELNSADARNLIEVPNNEILKRFAVDREINKSINKIMRAAGGYESSKWGLQMYDKFLSMWKSMHTGTFPFFAFHARNRTGGIFANQLTQAAAGDPRYEWYDPRKYLQPTMDAQVLQTGKKYSWINPLRYMGNQEGTITDLDKIPSIAARMQGLNPQQQMDELRKIAFENEVIGGKQGVAAEQIAESQDSLRNQLPGSSKEWSTVDASVPTIRKYFDPTAQKGVRGDQTEWLPALWGRDVAGYVEGQNRLSPFISLLRQGFDPQEAGRIVNKAQGDYTALTPIERDVMRRLFPFYSFSKIATQHYGQDLLDRPGGVTGRTIMAANSARDDDAMVPEHIAETVSIPLGENEDGTKNYLTGFGLGFEDPLSVFGPLAMGDIQGAGREVISRTNPLIKAAVEGTTGVSTFQRGPQGARLLEDMDPNIGRTLSNVRDLFTGERTENAQPFISPEFEFAAQNSPFSRYISTARTVTDPRKHDNPLSLAANLFTGARVAQVSPGAQDAIERGRLAQEMKQLGGRTFSTPYFPESSQANFDNDQSLRAEEILARLKELQARAKARRLKKQQQEQAAREAAQQ